MGGALAFQASTYLEFVLVNFCAFLDIKFFPIYSENNCTPNLLNQVGLYILREASHQSWSLCPQIFFFLSILVAVSFCQIWEVFQNPNMFSLEPVTNLECFASLTGSIFLAYWLNWTSLYNLLTSVYLTDLCHVSYNIQYQCSLNKSSFLGTIFLFCEF